MSRWSPMDGSWTVVLSAVRMMIGPPSPTTITLLPSADAFASRGAFTAGMALNESVLVAVSITSTVLSRRFAT
jgi:hypothetical protein